MTTTDIIRAHRHSSNHREEILASESCGCFHCCATIIPADIREWIDKWEGVGQTALCPQCGVDSVIGSESGYPVTREFLASMRDHWFSSK